MKNLLWGPTDLGAQSSAMGAGGGVLVFRGSHTRARVFKAALDRLVIWSPEVNT